MKKCSKCHIDKDEREFRIKKGKVYYQCRICEREALKLWRAKNKSHVKEYKREYERNNPERTRERKKLSDQRNRKKCNERSRKWAEKNRSKSMFIKEKYRLSNLDKCREMSRISAKRAYDANPEKYRELSRKWKIDNPELAKQLDKKRVIELHESYLIKCLILQGWPKQEIKKSHILIELKKVSIITKRKIKNHDS